ncbi:unnamed protein product [Owenia fusiformis]|uniref:Sulfotransferase domain-containing protein n=1 Tax=Owenia fusiformis TaxID=6347 RepID=A0A8S4Q938_OWEFU|nr:unnamed protein product [Owenia fusiformis]
MKKFVCIKNAVIFAFTLTTLQTIWFQSMIWKSPRNIKSVMEQQSSKKILDIPGVEIISQSGPDVISKSTVNVTDSAVKDTRSTDETKEGTTNTAESVHENFRRTDAANNAESIHENIKSMDGTSEKNPTYTTESVHQNIKSTNETSGSRTNIVEGIHENIKSTDEPNKSTNNITETADKLIEMSALTNTSTNNITENTDIDTENTNFELLSSGETWQYNPGVILDPKPRNRLIKSILDSLDELYKKRANKSREQLGLNGAMMFGPDFYTQPMDLFKNSDWWVKSKRLPGLLVIGVQKCGTGALKNFLNAHPNMASSPGEHHFFNTFYRESHVDEKIKLKDQILDVYLPSMPKTAENVMAFDKTPEYFDMSDPLHIYRMNPRIKLIIVICDPVRRSQSSYAHHYSAERYTESYLKYAISKNGSVNTEESFIFRGRYDKALERYLAIFPREQILILDKAYFKTHPLLVMNQVESFLNIPKFFTRYMFYYDGKYGYFCLAYTPWGFRGGCQGKGKYNTHAVLAEDVVKKLQLYYKPFNDRFMDLAGSEYQSLIYQDINGTEFEKHTLWNSKYSNTYDNTKTVAF